MAIALEFIDFVVPITRIREKYPGGWERCLRDHARLLGGRVWYDDHLFRDGAMGPAGIEAVVDRWAALGLEPRMVRGGKQVSHDICVVVSMFGGPTMPCEWLTFDGKQRIAYLTRTEPGKVVGREGYEGSERKRT